MRPITEVAARAGIDERYLEQYGRYKAKVDPALLNAGAERAGKLILVTAITPTAAGEGKTTTAIGLADALCRIGKNAVLAMREPSLGPVFGLKGGAAGGGYAQVVPMEDINLHFTGDIHAIGAAHNLLAAMVDNHIYQGNALNIDPQRVTWRRCVDMNDRQLRNIRDGLGKRTDGVPRDDGFDITVATETMAVFCLADSLADLKARLARMIVGYTYDGAPVTAAQLNAVGAMAALLKDAIKPNLVQTLEGTPAFVHGGPFANIAHGCNSVTATRMAMHLGDYAVTEAGFGADLGAEKFLDIKCRAAGLKPDAAVVVATVRALKMHGGADKAALDEENLAALAAGLPNLMRHVNVLKDTYGLNCVVAINRFPSDTAAELRLVEEECRAAGVNAKLCEVWAKGGAGGEELAREVVRLCAAPEDFRFPSDTAAELRLVEEECRAAGVNAKLCEVWAKGGAGGEELAREVVRLCAAPEDFRFAYALTDTIEEKLAAVTRRVYGGRGVIFTDEARAQLEALNAQGFGKLPVCVAKTQYSFSDDKTKLGAPEDFDITVRELRVSAGAGFIVALTGDILTMPGLPKRPAAEGIDVDGAGRITGLF